MAEVKVRARFNLGCLRRAVLWAGAALAFSGCGGGGADVEEVRLAMHTAVKCRAIAPDRATAEAAVAAAFAAVSAAEAVASYGDEKSELSAVNARAGEGPVAVSPLMGELIELGDVYAAATEGWFDPTTASLTDLYGIKQELPRWPAEEEVNEALSYVDYGSVRYDRKTRTVYFARPGIKLDYSALAKGWAVDKALAAMREAGATAGLVEAGGEVACFGGGPSGREWRLGIKDPRGEGRYASWEWGEGACATSGDYEQRYEADGHVFSHLINPRTGRPTAAAASVTVFAPTCAEADAWATALAVMPAAAAAEILKRPDAPPCLIMRPGQDGLSEERYKSTPALVYDSAP